MESQSLFHGPIVDDFRPCLRTVTLHSRRRATRPRQSQHGRLLTGLGSVAHARCDSGFEDNSQQN